MEATKSNVRQELDKIVECLCVAEERLGYALEAVNGRDLRGDCVAEERCGVADREPGIMERLMRVGKLASCVAGKAEELTSAL